MRVFAAPVRLKRRDSDGAEQHHWFHRAERSPRGGVRERAELRRQKRPMGTKMQKENKVALVTAYLGGGEEEREKKKYI